VYDPVGKTVVSPAMIVCGLRELGLCEGELLQVHSSLSAFGYVEGGAEAVVDALLEVVGPSGTVMVPTFNHGRVEVFDVRTTPSYNGAITEALRKRPQAHRSVHPTHPYAAIGPLAEELTREHLGLLTFDRRSPLGKLADMGGKVLLLGVGMDRNTAAHLGETMARVHCLGYRQFPRKILAPDGSVQEAWSVLWRNGPCKIEWAPLESAMRARDMIIDGRIGDAPVHLMKAKDVIDTAFALTRVYCPRCETKPLPLPEP
jgi:aminoglycoside 3-N-acetyltransferase